MPLEPLTLTLTRTGEEVQLHVRSSHTILAGSITIDELDRLAALFQAEALALRRERNRITPPDYYAVLGVAPTATGEEIQQAYRTLAKGIHPDTNAAGSTLAMQQLNQAYAVLGDPQQRQQYDTTL